METLSFYDNGNVTDYSWYASSSLTNTSNLSEIELSTLTSWQRDAVERLPSEGQRCLYDSWISNDQPQGIRTSPYLTSNNFYHDRSYRSVCIFHTFQKLMDFLTYEVCDRVQLLFTKKIHCNQFWIKYFDIFSGYNYISLTPDDMTCS